MNPQCSGCDKLLPAIPIYCECGEGDHEDAAWCSETCRDGDHEGPDPDFDDETLREA